MLVSNEVGLGLVPETPLGRRFRDAQGRLNQRVAGVADDVVFIAAGLPLSLKRSHPRGARMTRVPVTVITGFLGAGKTTLIRTLLTQADGRRIAIIVNEFGDVGFDGGLLEDCAAKALRAGRHRRADQWLHLLHGRRRFPADHGERCSARDRPLDPIVIETSGLALPQPLVQAFAWPSVRTRVTVDGVVTVVDALALAEGRFAPDEDAVAAQRAADRVDRSRRSDRGAVRGPARLRRPRRAVARADLVGADALADDRAAVSSARCGPACASCARAARSRRRS